MNECSRAPADRRTGSVMKTISQGSCQAVSRILFLLVGIRLYADVLVPESAARPFPHCKVERILRDAGKRKSRCVGLACRLQTAVRRIE